MDDILITLIISAASAGLSSVVTYLATRWKIRLELEAEYDKELRGVRIGVYKDLWKTLEPLARYSPPGPVTYITIKDLSERMRKWYFEGGGIYLSKKSREPYFGLKGSLKKIIDNEELRSKPNDPLDTKIIEPILEEGSKLRAGLSWDIGTRREPLLSEN
jgi:hypothetical protein